MLVFYVKANPYPVKPYKLLHLEEVCDEGLMLSINSQSYPLRIYTRNSKTRFNKVYRANETHLWKS
jgi:hypothetical protein